MSANQNGALTEAVYYILLSIQTPLHGYGIMQNIEQLSSGRVRLAAGTLYGAISTMLEKGWITAIPGEKDSRKKEYQITSLGKEIVAVEMCRLEELLKNGKIILGVSDYEKNNQ
ncbi:transcriptional regulator, PadR family [Syntrophobotulus glycolicus DSM 8271]|uniref:Transcriptional regulator, PadR family n=1 Tax=Syntrophobotulus glycolicus (strain DSM 8271 / FlGlyR) TaxID=645991 RepID=F0T235_SYNGF|nr:helix-turn-helix transcriptional regulator [Syntrophobotulus glycolicus]ADY56379.1 transcriptional regulator, PadR family [Syntrophobotulus glycolicus DSM 8271]